MRFTKFDIGGPFPIPCVWMAFLRTECGFLPFRASGGRFHARNAYVDVAARQNVPAQSRFAGTLTHGALTADLSLLVFLRCAPEA